MVPVLNAPKFGGKLTVLEKPLPVFMSLCGMLTAPTKPLTGFTSHR